MQHTTIVARLFLVFALLNLVLFTGCAGPREAVRRSEAEAARLPEVCTGERYLKLREQNLEDMSEREYEYFIQKDHACDAALAWDEEQQRREAGRGVGTAVLVGGALLVIAATIGIVRMNTLEGNSLLD